MAATTICTSTAATSRRIYDATEAEVITPALSCDSPSKNKMFHCFDVGAEGTWTLSVGCDPNNQATEEDVATFTGSTYVNPTMSMPEAEHPHLAALPHH